MESFGFRKIAVLLKGHCHAKFTVFWSKLGKNLN